MGIGEKHACEVESRVQVERFLRLIDGGIVFTGVVQHGDEERVDDDGGGIELSRPFCLCSRFGEPPLAEKSETVPVMSRRVPRPQLDGALELAVRAIPVAFTVHVRRQ